MLLPLGSLLDRAIGLSIQNIEKGYSAFFECGPVPAVQSWWQKTLLSPVKISEAIEIHDTLPDRLSSWY